MTDFNVEREATRYGLRPAETSDGTSPLRPLSDLKIESTRGDTRSHAVRLRLLADFAMIYGFRSST